MHTSEISVTFNAKIVFLVIVLTPKQTMTVYLY